MARNLPNPLKTPKLLLHGITDQRGELSNVEWVLWEWIQTDDSDDSDDSDDADDYDDYHENFANIVSQDVKPKLSASLRNMNLSMLEGVKQVLPVYESIDSYLSYLQNELIPLITLPHTELGFNPDQSLSTIKEVIIKSGYGRQSVEEFCLIHQDLHGGNVLCRKINQDWALAAVIDWESAALAPIEFLMNSDTTPLKHLFIFAQILKNAWLASGLKTDSSQLPRCNLEELMHHTNEWLDELKNAGLLSCNFKQLTNHSTGPS